MSDRGLNALEPKDIWDAFSATFGHAPYPYQERVASALLGGTNVLLRAPTGAGKTKAALFPFLYARSRGISFADRMLYAVPMRTLVSALYEETRSMVATRAPDLRVTIQMGGQQEDPNLEGDIVFATIDQVLSAYVGAPVSLPGKNANIVGASTLGSLIVFDEFHLLDPGKALATATDLARRLAGLSQVLIMSATVTSDAAKILCDRLNADLIQVSDGELAEMPSQATKVRRIHYFDHPLSVADVLTNHAAAKRTIAVVNTVDRAQTLYRDVVAAADPFVRPHVRLLHSRFLKEDRRSIEKWAIETFKEGSSAEGILISTQVIEVGLNISARVLHTELAPASAVFQRAGRCARFANEEGDVNVYALPVSDSGQLQVAPYEADERPRIAATGAEIARRNGTHVSYSEELAVTEVAYAARDAELLGQTHLKAHEELVSRAMAGIDDSAAADLIRDADSVSVAVYDDPTILGPRSRLESFSLARPTFRRFAKDVLEHGLRLWALESEQTAAGPWVPVWRRIASERELRGVVWACVTSASACYDERLGLQMNLAGHWQSKVSPAPAQMATYRYVRETYQEHIARVRDQIVRLGPRYGVAGERLARRFHVSSEALAGLVCLAGELHDVGKLTSAWQDKAWAWQTDAHGTARDGFLAHTDLDLSDPSQRARSRQSQYRFPSHAPEGAYSTMAILQEVADGVVPNDEARADELTRALFSAIARHHGASTHQLEDFSLPAQARSEAASVLSPHAKADFEDRPDAATRGAFRTWLTEPSERDGFLLYWYVSRRLRLADQQATAEASK